jgi:Helix-hairpin-helix motif
MRRAGTAHWNFLRELTANAVRLGLRTMRGLANTDGAAIIGARAGAPFATVVDIWRRSNACMIWTTAKKKRMVGLLSGGRD